jgi:uncharacterized protein DUF2330
MHSASPPPSENESVITDEKMIFSISKDQTTLYDEIHYSGSPSSFAWVLPIKGTVTVGLSADILFETIDQLTATQVVEPTPNCPVPECSVGEEGGSSGEAGAGGGDGGSSVTVLSQNQVGPYETVQLHSSDGSALTDWLQTNGYVISKADAPVIAAYVAEHFDFLALKLLPGEGVQTMQLVRVTSKGASISLPLHMVAVGTGATTGITIWVVADGRWEPFNFPTFTISDSEIVWDWNTSSSNYETLRLAKEAAFGGKGWQIESSLEMSQYSIQTALLSSLTGDDSNGGDYTPVGGEDASVLDGGHAQGAGDAGDAGDDADSLRTPAEDEAADQDLAVLFAGISGPNVRITRMRSDVAHSALSVDMVLQASSDQGELTNLHYPSRTAGEPPCPPLEDYCYGDDAGLGAMGDKGGCSATGSPNGPGTTLVILARVSGLVGASFRRRR